jgi:hypothetical protein
MVFIDLKLVILPQLPPKIWPPKMPNIPSKWAKSTKNPFSGHKNQLKSQNHILKTHFSINYGLKPL